MASSFVQRHSSLKTLFFRAESLFFKYWKHFYGFLVSWQKETNSLSPYIKNSIVRWFIVEHFMLKRSSVENGSSVCSRLWAIVLLSVLLSKDVYKNLLTSDWCDSGLKNGLENSYRSHETVVFMTRREKLIEWYFIICIQIHFLKIGILSCNQKQKKGREQILWVGLLCFWGKV